MVDHPGFTTLESGALREVAHVLRLDAMTAETTAALRREGVRAVLLKGPVIARAFYGDGDRRCYGDVDLLIKEADAAAAAAVFLRLGFTSPTGGEFPNEWLVHGIRWERGASEVVDLHRSLCDIHLPSSEVWTVLAENTASITLGGTPVEVLGADRLALLLALHAAQHGRGHAKSIEDLRRAVSSVEPQVWRSAATLADRLRVRSRLLLGLRLVPMGAEIADSLGGPSPPSVVETLRARNASNSSVTLARVSEAPGPRAVVSAAFRTLVPTPTSMRHIYPLARRGGVGLAITYAQRLFSIAVQAPGSLRIFLLERRSVMR